MVLVRAPVAPLDAEPRVGSEQVSQALAGHGLTVLDAQGPWLHVHTADAYEGWVHRGYTMACAPDQPMAGDATSARTIPGTTTLRQDTRRVSLGCTVRAPDGRRWMLPLGALVDDEGQVEHGSALTPAEMSERFPGTPAAIAHTALELFAGTAYQWGGITPWGADCSGFVQMTFALHGVPLPRDTGPQSRAGADAAMALDGLRPADLLFFSERPDGRVTHVAIALGPMRIVHLGLGRGAQAVERLDDVSDPYVADLVRWLRAVRRVV